MNDVAKARIDTGLLAGGVVMITIGVLFLLSRLDIAEFGQIARRYWPMILPLIGIPKLFARDTVWSGLWLIALGAWLQVAHLQMFGLTYRSSWPLLVIALGAGMILRAVVDAVLRPREERHER